MALAYSCCVWKFFKRTKDEDEDEEDELLLLFVVVVVADDDFFKEEEFEVDANERWLLALRSREDDDSDESSNCTPRRRVLVVISLLRSSLVHGMCIYTLYNLREKILEEECVSRRKRRLFSIASRSQKISLFSLLKFFGLCPFSPKKKLSLSQKQESGVLLLSLIVSSLLSLSEENKSNLFTFILSRPARVSRSFIKECLYIRRTLLSLLHYSYQGTEERERAESANTLSL